MGQVSDLALLQVSGALHLRHLVHTLQLIEGNALGCLGIELVIRGTLSLDR